MTSKTPYEIRLELIREARLILQARADDKHTGDRAPTHDEVTAVAEELNRFVSKKPTNK